MYLPKKKFVMKKQNAPRVRALKENPAASLAEELMEAIDNEGLKENNEKSVNVATSYPPAQSSQPPSKKHKLAPTIDGALNLELQSVLDINVKEAELDDDQKNTIEELLLRTIVYYYSVQMRGTDNLRRKMIDDQVNNLPKIQIYKFLYLIDVFLALGSGKAPPEEGEEDQEVAERPDVAGDYFCSV